MLQSKRFILILLLLAVAPDMNNEFCKLTLNYPIDFFFVLFYVNFPIDFSVHSPVHFLLDFPVDFLIDVPVDFPIDSSTHYPAYFVLDFPVDFPIDSSVQYLVHFLFIKDTNIKNTGIPWAIFINDGFLRPL